MKKFKFVILLAFLLTSSILRSETGTNDFEEELRLLENKELYQEQKAEALVEKMATQTEAILAPEVITDSVSAKNSAILKPTETIIEKPVLLKKNRRIPSR